MKQPSRTAVWKFGGTSLGNAERFSSVAELVQGRSAGLQLVVVSSAMAGVTAALTEICRMSGEADQAELSSRWERLETLHRETAEALLPTPARAQYQEWISGQFESARSLVHGFSLVRETTPRALDAVVSLGEVLSTALLAATLGARGERACYLDAVQLIVTDDHHGDANPLLEPTRENATRLLQPLLQRGEIPVVTGFRGAAPGGIPTTLGRGGSDLTATVLAAALGADETWIWTDVAGIMTADPRLVRDAHLLHHLSYRETVELSFFGARVLHGKSVLPAAATDIPILIKNSFDPAAPGTWISGDTTGDPGVRALTALSEVTLFTVSGGNIIRFTRLAARIFRLLDLDEVQTLMVTQSSAENVVCFAVRDQDRARVSLRLRRELEFELLHHYVAEIEEMSEIGVVVAVGDRMKGTVGVAARMFGALQRRKINVVAISQGSSELSISCAVAALDVAEAVRAIHREFDL